MNRLLKPGWILVLAASSLLAAGSAHSTPPAYVAGTWIDVTGHVEINLPDSVARSGFGLVADHDPDYAGPLRADFFMLTVPTTKTRTQPPVEWRLESRDSTLRIALADVTGDGIEDLVTVCRTARATEPRGELLSVWVWNERPLSRILDVVIRGNLPEPWWYKPAIRDVDGDGVLDLELNRGDGGVMRPKDNPYLIPPDGPTIVYSFDRTTRKMKPTLTASVPNGSSNLRMHATVGVGPAANMKRLRSPTARDTAR